MLPLLALLSLARADPGSDIAASAERYLKRRPPLSDRTCTGLATAVLRDAGYELSGNVRNFYEDTQSQGWNHRRKTPSPGDLVYFDYTWDSNRDGRANDKLTHIAVVISVDAEGTALMVHHGGQGISPLRMNLYQPDVYTDADGHVLNDYLAAPGYGPKDRRLAGQLWAGFATVEGGGAVASLWSDTPSYTPTGYAPDGPLWQVQQVPTRRKPRYERLSPDGAAWPYTRSGKPRGGTPEGRIVRGRRVGKRALWGSSCDDLWYLRNAIYARHGYSFVSDEARAVFGAEPWYLVDPEVTEATAELYLSVRDKRNVLRLLELESRAGCGG
jgi:hypothetical protein